MAPTLAELLAVPGLGLRVLAGAEGRPGALRRPVTWVAVSELADPTPYLQGGELVLLTGLGADVAAGAPAYVGRLVRVGAAGIGFGVGVVHEAVPAELLTAADAAGLPLLEVDRPTPFVAVGKALAHLLAVERGERDRRRIDGMRALTADLAGSTDPEAALQRLADLTGGWAALLDARARVVFSAGDRSRPDVARRLAGQLAGQLRGRSGRSSAAEADELGRVTVLPLVVREGAGYLAVGVAAGTDLDHQLVAFAASLLTLDRERARGALAVRRWARSAALAARTGLAPPAPEPAVLGPAGSADGVRALVVERPLDAALGALPDEDAVSGLSLGAAHTLLVLADADTEEVLAALDGSTGGLSAAVPAGSPPTALAEAVESARSLAARSRGGVLRAGQAPPSLLDLLDEVGPGAAAAFAAGVLGPLHAAPDAPVLEATLRAYLVAHGGLVAAAERLGVHRHTLRTRLRRIAALLGRDLDDVSTSAELWVALCATARETP